MFIPSGEITYYNGLLKSTKSFNTVKRYINDICKYERYLLFSAIEKLQGVIGFYPINILEPLIKIIEKFEIFGVGNGECEIDINFPALYEILTKLSIGEQEQLFGESGRKIVAEITDKILCKALSKNVNK